MKYLIRGVVAFVVLAPLVATGQEAAPSNPSGHGRGAMYRHKASLVPPPAPETIEAPSLPLPMAPMAPTEIPLQPPRVSFRAGVLTVDSQNSKLGDILKAIHTLTGTEFDPMPEIAERTAVHLVGSPGDVVSSLLRGSSYGYVLISSSDDSTILQKVMLIAAEPAAGATAAAMASGRPPATRPALPPSPYAEPVAAPAASEPVAPAPAAEAAAASPASANPAAATPNAIAANAAAAATPAATKDAAVTTASDDPPKDAPNPATLQGIAMPDPVQFAAQPAQPKTDSSGQPAMSAAGQYMQELYRLRVQQQSQNGGAPAVASSPQ